MVAMSCDHASKSAKDKEDAEETQGKAEKELATKKVSYHYEKDNYSVEINADFPTTGNKGLCTAIAEAISEELGGNYDGEVNNGQSMIDFYGNAHKEQLYKEGEDMSDIPDMPNLSFLMNVTKGYETENLVTFMFEGYIYLGGAHGTECLYGITFRKSDGRRFSADMMKDTDSEQWNKLTKEELKAYFSKGSGEKVTTDEDLKSFVIAQEDVDFIKLPEKAPYVTADGLTFTYQPYEISFYAAGTPTYSLNADKVKPFLNQTGLNLLGL